MAAMEMRYPADPPRVRVTRARVRQDAGSALRTLAICLKAGRTVRFARQNARNLASRTAAARNSLDLPFAAPAIG
jgi:hypothetical protein